MSWKSRLQKCVALSTTWAKFIAATEASKEMLCQNKFLEELGFKQKSYALFCDNQRAVHLGKNSSFHFRLKLIDVRYHWIRDVLDEKLLEHQKIHSDYNGSDVMMKTLPRKKLEHCLLIAAMINPSTLSWGRHLLDGFTPIWRKLNE